MKQWIIAQTNCSGGDAARLRRLAKVIDIVPALGDALRDGHVGNAQAHEFARAASNPRVGEQIDSVAPILLQHAEHLGFDDFRVVVRRWEMLADLDGAERNDEVSHERRTASVLDVDGSVRVRASGGTGMVTAEAIGIFQQFVDAEFAKDVAARTAEFGPDAPASKLPRTDAQRRFDAMVTLFRAAVTAPADGVAPTPVVNVVVGTWAAPSRPTSARSTTWTNGTPTAGPPTSCPTSRAFITRCGTGCSLNVRPCAPGIDGSIARVCVPWKRPKVAGRWTTRSAAPSSADVARSRAQGRSATMRSI